MLFCIDLNDEIGVNAGSTANEPCLFLKRELVRLTETCVDEDNVNSENEFGSCLSRPSSKRK